MKASKMVEQLQRMIEAHGDKEVCLWELDIYSFESKDNKWFQTTAEDVKVLKFKNDSKFKTTLDDQEVFMIVK